MTSQYIDAATRHAENFNHLSVALCSEDAGFDRADVSVLLEKLGPLLSLAEEKYCFGSGVSSAIVECDKKAVGRINTDEALKPAHKSFWLGESTPELYQPVFMFDSDLKVLIPLVEMASDPVVFSDLQQQTNGRAVQFAISDVLRDESRFALLFGGSWGVDSMVLVASGATLKEIIGLVFGGARFSDKFSEYAKGLFA